MQEHRTKIVATLGPASNTYEIINALVTSGANVFRMNFSHGSYNDHRRVHEIIRRVEIDQGMPIGILVDLQGPKLRVGEFKEAVELHAGHEFTFTLAEIEGTSDAVTLPHPEIFQSLNPNDELLVDDGRLRFQTLKVSPSEILTKVIIGGKITDRKGVNLPNRTLSIAALTEKDREDLQFALGLGIDWVALSFVQTAQDIIEAQHLIQGQARIIAKIEKPVAVENFDAILAVTDAIMVARGDLGVEYEWQDVPTVQKNIIKRCRAVGKPVIVATQMLESMIESSIPTRAEVSDVANAVFDGADAVMLSAESAAGAFPIQAVSAMAAVACSAKKEALSISKKQDVEEIDATDDSTSIASAVCMIAELRSASHIITYTETGSTALRVAKMRPSVPILAICSSLKIARMLSLVWGVNTKVSQSQDEYISYMCGKAPPGLFPSGHINANQPVVVTSGSKFGVPGGTDSIKIAYMEH